MDDSRPNYPQLLESISALLVIFRMFVPLLIPAAFLLLSACAATDPNNLPAVTVDSAGVPSGNRNATRDRAQRSHALTTATDPGSQVPVDEKSGLVAANLVSALQQIFRQRALSPEISFERPENSFEYHLVEKLQRAGFAVFVARPQLSGQFSGDSQMFYGIERVSRGNLNGKSKNNSDNDMDFNDYSFQLSIKDFVIERQYRVSAESVHPLSPMVFRTKLLEQMKIDRLQDNQLPNVDASRQPIDKMTAEIRIREPVLLPTDDSLFYN